MRHRVAHRKLGRKTEHRISLLRNLAVSLIMHERIRTTLAKAKELRPFAEKLVTLGKKDSLHARRRALSIIPRKRAVAKLFNELSPRFAERPGGYTRILKLGPRRGDGAAMAFIEFVDFTFRPTAKAGKPSAKEEKRAAKEATKPVKPAEPVESDEPEAAAEAREKTEKKAKKPAGKKKTASKKKTTPAKSGEKKATKKKTGKKKTTKKKSS